MAKSSSTSIGALKYLMSPGNFPRRPVIVVAGDDGFMRHEVRVELTRVAEDWSCTTFDGSVAELCDVNDALFEHSLFGSTERMVLVEQADPFVKAHRESLEAYVAKPAKDASLILEVSSWPANTRLAKAVAKTGLTIRSHVPSQGRERSEFVKQLADWLINLAQHQCEVQLQRSAVDRLLDLLPTQPGILLQEVSKLALLAKGGVIDAKLVSENVGGWRTQKTWDMIDAAAEGRAAVALEQLDRLLAAGEEPHALLPQMASTLRRFAGAVRVFEQDERRGRRGSLRSALEKAGVPPFKLKSAESQLRQIGRPRAKQLYRWLLTADLALKGHNSTKDRARRVLETLIIRLAQPSPSASAPR